MGVTVGVMVGEGETLTEDTPANCVNWCPKKLYAMNPATKITKAAIMPLVSGDPNFFNEDLSGGGGGI